MMAKTAAVGVFEIYGLTPSPRPCTNFSKLRRRKHPFKKPTHQVRARQLRYIFVYIYVYKTVWIQHCVSVCVYIYIYIYIYIYTGICTVSCIRITEYCICAIVFTRLTCILSSYRLNVSLFSF